MRVSACLSAVLLCCVAAAEDQNLSITWIGQSSFIIRSMNAGATVVTDPPAPSVGYALPKVNADAVTITHNHTDHNNSAGVGGTFTLVDGRPVTARQEMAAAGLNFVLIPGFHDNQNGAVRGPNTMIRWRQAGLNIVHLGDLGQDQLTDAQMSDLQDIDILFMPAGGFFTITPERAAAYITQLNPHITILMHYKTALGGPAQLAPLPAAAAPFSPVVYKPYSVTVSRSTLPAGTEVWVMQPESDSVAANSAGFTAGAPVAPGSLVTMFGTFPGVVAASATGYPWPRSLGGAELRIDGQPVPVSYVSPQQINFQLPAGTAAGQSLGEVRIGGQTVTRAPVTVLPNAPGIFAVVNPDGRLNTPAAPAHRGDVLEIFGTGQGAVAPAVDDGAAAGQPLSNSLAMPNVFLGGRQLEVRYSGLAPGFAGVWQINAVIPKDAVAGSTFPLEVVLGIGSNRVPVTLAE